MEDYIFLIIAIVLSIFGAINKKKKNVEGANPAPERAQRPRNFFMDQILGEDFPDDSEEEIKPPVRVKPFIRKEPVVSPRPAASSGLFHMGFKSTLPEQKKNPYQTLSKRVEPDEKQEDFDSTESECIMDDFSLRKAFVYSEILQRKY